MKFEAPKCIAPTPAARLDKTTTAAAWRVADLSCSTSSYNSGSIFIALKTLIKKIFFSFKVRKAPVFFYFQELY